MPLGNRRVNRKRLLNILRVVISVGLIIFVCRNIRLSDTLVRTDGTEFTGRLVVTGPDRFVIDTPDHGRVTLAESELRHSESEGTPHLSGVLRGIITVFRDIDLAWYLPAFLCLGLVPALGALRFQLLLGVQGIALRVGRVFQLTFIGNIFNNFMLGLTGGDLVKADYVARETQKRTEAVITVFLDRIVGLIGLAVLAAAMIAVNFGDPKFRIVAVYVWAFLAMACLLVLVLYSRRLRRNLHYTLLAAAGLGAGVVLGWRVCAKGWDTVSQEVYLFLGVVALFALFALLGGMRRLRLERLRERLAGSKLVRETDQTFHVLSQHPGESVMALFMSFVNHFATIVAIFCLARSLGIEVQFHYFLVFIPVIVMIAAIPVSMAGWGVQEAVFQMFFGSVGVSATEAITLSFVYRISYGLLWSLPGGVFLMWRKDRPSAHDVEEAMTGGNGTT